MTDTSVHLGHRQALGPFHKVVGFYIVVINNIYIYYFLVRYYVWYIYMYSCSHSLTSALLHLLQ